MKSLMIFSLLMSFSTFSTTIAVIDSGVDVKHEVFDNKTWINPVEIADNNRDEDRNGYQDDVYGWNFAESNNQIIDYKYLGTFSDTPRKFFEIQLKLMLGSATADEIQWMRDIRTNDEAIKELQKFGNFVHGTHVAGIAANGENNEILSVKLIPTESPLSSLDLTGVRGEDDSMKIKVLKGLLSQLAAQQSVMLKEIAFYVHNHGARVANGSFGTGTPQARMIISLLYKTVFQNEPSEADLANLSSHFISQLVKGSEEMLKLAPKTLFVFASGNDGLDNDTFGTSPANARAKNTMSVAATYQNRFLAGFSNYGESKVDIAAPGMGIDSAIPGNEYLVVSGTSQAAPYVASIAGSIFNVNPNLDPADVKRIIMDTADSKDFLSQKVVSNGVINELRALEAAVLSRLMDLDSSINQAKLMIVDQNVDEARQSINTAIAPIQMPSYFGNLNIIK